MTDESRAARPSQVTMAGWVAIVGSTLLVLTLFESVRQLSTVEFRDTVEEFLATPPGNGLGLGIEQVVSILRVMMYVAAAAAAAAVVLAVHVLKRNNAARIAFTVAAVALVLTAPVSGGFLAVMVAMAAAWLWTRPARDWFAGRPVSQPVTRGRDTDDQHLRGEGTAMSENQPPHEPGSWPRMPEGEDRPAPPPPTQGYGRPGGQGESGSGSSGQGSSAAGSSGHGSSAAGAGQPSYGQGGGSGQGGYPQSGSGGYPQGGSGGYPQGASGQGGGYGQTGPYGGGQPGPYGYGQQYGGPAGFGSPRQGDPDKRPASVTTAAWLTWVLAGLALLGFLISGIALAVARDDVVSMMQEDPTFADAGIPADQAVAVIWVIVAIMVFWSLAAILLAVFAFRRANWARITLVVSSVITGLFCLLGAINGPLLLLWALGSFAAAVLLFVGGANQWYSRRSSGGGQGGYSGGQPYGQPYGSYGQGQSYGQPGPGQQGRPPYGSPYGQQPPPYGSQQYGQQSGPQQGQHQHQGYGSPQYGQPPAYGQQPPQSGQRPAAYGQDQETQGSSRHEGDQEGHQESSRHEDERSKGRKEDPPPNVW